MAFPAKCLIIAFDGESGREQTYVRVEKNYLHVSPLAKVNRWAVPEPLRNDPWRMLPIC